MKSKHILISDFSHAHPLFKGAYPTDIYYTKLANRIFDDFCNTHVDFLEKTESIFRYAAITLACYMEDIVADSGQWRAFSDLCQQMYGWPVPIYHDNDEEYYPDEPSLMAVRYLIWHAATEMDDIWWNPNLPQLKTLARTAYLRLTEEFEKAPVNEQLSEDIDSMMDDAANDFYKMRHALKWIYFNDYITRSFVGELLMGKWERKSSRVIKNSFMNKYDAMNSCIFAYKIGPLALYPKDYLAALARAKDKSSLLDSLDAMEVFPTCTFQMKVSEDRKTIGLLSTHGRAITVNREEITLKDKVIGKYDGCVASFVLYKDEWFLNGVLAPLEDCFEHWEELVKNDPEYMPEGHVTADADWYLRHTKGRQMLFFAGREETKRYLIKELNFSEDGVRMLDQDNSSDQPTMIFIDKDEPKNCLQFTFGFCESIKSPDNPFYEEDTARMEAVEMLWNDECVGTGAMLYMLDHGFLPEILTCEFIMQDNPTEVKDQDARFLLRYMRKERY